MASFLESRQELRKTQEEMAKAMGVGVRTIRRWETGETKVPRTAEILLARLKRER